MSSKEKAGKGKIASNVKVTNMLSAQLEPQGYNVSTDEFMEREGVSTQKLDQVMGFFLTHAKAEVTRRKFHYFLAFCSVFLVIVSTLVINQIITKSSIIFLKMSEATHGEIDAFITPSADIVGHTSDGLEYSMGSLLNYTAIEAKYNIPGDKEA